MIRRSTALWRGDGPHGSGALTTQSQAFREQPYSFKTRFESADGKAGTNQEELLAAAHAGCYAMALAFALGNDGHPPAELNVAADVDLEKVAEGFAITVDHPGRRGSGPRYRSGEVPKHRREREAELPPFEGACRDPDHAVGKRIQQSGSEMGF